MKTFLHPNLKQIMLQGKHFKIYVHSLIVFVLFLTTSLINHLDSQINYTQSFVGCNANPCNNWEWDLAGGTINSTPINGYTPCTAANPAAAVNLDGVMPTANLSSTVSLGTSNNEVTRVGFSYKVIDLTTGNATPANSCTFNVQWGVSATGPWNTIQTFQNMSSTSCNAYMSPIFFATPGSPIFMRINLNRSNNNYWVVVDDITLTQAAPSVIDNTGCLCNNDQTPNNNDGTYNNVLRIKAQNNIAMASGLSYTLRSSTNLLNSTGGPIGTPTFTFCNGTGCPTGILNGQYYLNVKVTSLGSFSANVDGPDPDTAAEIVLSNTNCSPAYPALPIIPLLTKNCLETGDNVFGSDGGVYSEFNVLASPILPDGFSQIGTGNLVINNETFVESDNDPTFELYLIKENMGCRVSSFKEFNVFKSVVADIKNTLINCRNPRTNDVINLSLMLDDNNTGGGKFFIAGAEVVDGDLMLNGNTCVSVTYSVTDSCGVSKSDTKSLQVVYKPKAGFNFDNSPGSPISPVCSANTVTVNLIRTSTGSNPQFSVETNKPGFGTPTLSGNTLTLPAPPIGNDIKYKVCLIETNPAPAVCAGIVPSTLACADTICKNFIVYRDISDCGANALFTSQCEAFLPDFCPTSPSPSLDLGCQFFTIEGPDILSADIEIDQGVVNCTDTEITGSFNVSLFGIDANGAGGGQTLSSFPGLGTVCSIFNFKVFGFRPLGALYNLLGCDRTIAQFILGILSNVAGGDGGGYIVMADTDGDGAFDYLVEDGYFPSGKNTFTVPNRVKGAGYITIRAVGGYVNSPSSVCGNFDIEGINLLDLIPIGAIPIVGAVIEDILAAAGCGANLAFSAEKTESVQVINNATPVLLNCNPSGYVFAQTLDCVVPVDWSVPLANDGCSGELIAYQGPTSGADISKYAGTIPPTVVTIAGPGIYQTAGPIPGSILEPGIYPVTYTTLSCNGLPELCTFNVVVTSGSPILECPVSITVNADAGVCSSRVNGLSPYQGVGCASIINYSYTKPVTNTVVETNSTTIGTHNIPDGHYFELGTTVINYTMQVDINGDGDYDDVNPDETQTCSFTIVVEDNQEPIAKCLDIELNLNNEGLGTVYAGLTPGQIYLDGGSTDNCPGNLLVEISKDRINYFPSLNFDCSEKGQNIINFRVTDASGNVSYCKSVVKVIDFFEGFKLDLDVPEVCFEPFQNTYDFSKYIVIAKPNGVNVTHANVGTLGPNVFGAFGISTFLPDAGSTNDPGTITTDGIYTIGTGTGYITISYILSIDEQVNQIDDTSPLAGCFRMVHDVFRIEKLDPIWKGGYMCCDQLPIWLGGATWDGTGAPPIPTGMLSLTDIRGSYPVDAYGEWVGQGVTFVNPDNTPFTGDEFYQFDPNGLDGTYSLTYIVGDEPCIFTYAQDIRVTCQDLQIELSDITVCPANLVPERVVIVNLDDKDLVVSTTGFAALAADGAHYGGGPVADPVMDLMNVPVVNGRVVIPAFYAPAVRNKDYEICIEVFQSTPFGCADIVCYTITVQDLEAPVFQNCPKEPIIVDAPAGWCSSFVNFEYPFAEDNCLSFNSKLTQVDTTGLKSGDLFPVGLTILSYSSIDTVGNQSYCEIKIIVNDYHTPPTVTCPSDVVNVLNDPDKCSAVVNNIALVDVSDNCIDNVNIQYEIKDKDGLSIACGFTDASGSVFPVGTNKVTYKVEDQPLLLITEILQNGTVSGVEITNFGPAAVDITCAKFILKDADGNVLETYTLPTNNNISTIINQPIFPPIDPIIWNIRNPDNIMQVGETFTHIFDGDQNGDGIIDVVNTYNRCDVRKYCFAFLDRVIDEVTINDKVKGTTILRKNECDNNAQSDFIPATACDPGSFGMLNPGLTTMAPNGTQTSLQNYAPSKAVCSFTVTVKDVEAPVCIYHDTIPKIIVVAPLAPAQPLLPNMCLKSTVTMPAGIIDDVNIFNLKMTIANAGAVTAYLRSPDGTRIKLFERVCATNTDACVGNGIAGSPNIDINLDDTRKWIPSPSVVNAVCTPSMGAGGFYRPLEAFKAFYGLQGGGVWTLELFADEGVVGTLTDWDLQILYRKPFDQGDVVLNNAPTLCTQDFSWIHPILEDNCCVGTVDITYDFKNDITKETSVEKGVIKNLIGNINTQGCRLTRTFKVGVTTITYTLIDKYGNESECSFTVTVNDVEKPTFPFGCADRTIYLAPGECTGQLVGIPKSVDNCSDTKVTFCDENGVEVDYTMLPIGVYKLIQKSVDIYGNIGRCEFTMTVVEYIPTNNTLACNNHVNISLGADCTATVTPDMILEGGPYRCYENYCLTVTYSNGNSHSSTFTLADVGKTFTVSVKDCNGNNSCWGTILIEDKLVPKIECPIDVTLECNGDPLLRYPKDHPFQYQLVTGELKILSCETNSRITFEDHLENLGKCNNPRAILTRKWRIIDVRGREAVCDQIITFNALDLDSIEFPMDLNMDKSLHCGEVAINPTLTTPAYTGSPTINGKTIFGKHYCDINVGFYDIKLDDANCAAGYEILRHWNIRNECAPLIFGINPYVHIQSIKVDDIKAPVLRVLTDTLISVDPWTCRASIKLPNPVIKEDCSDYTIKWYTGYGEFKDKDSLGNYYMLNMLKGTNILIAKVVDACGNESRASFKVRVIDATAPVAVAKQNIVVSLTGNGITPEGSAKLYAKDVDNFSYDGCTEVRVEVRRVAGGSCGNVGSDGKHNNNSTYNDNNGLPSEVPGQVWFHPNDSRLDTDGGEYVKFCCEDIPVGEAFGLHEVEMRVWDDGNMNGQYGDNLIIDGMKDNYNTTWVTVRVENKLPPAIACPKDVTVTCDMLLNLSLDGKVTSVDSVNLTMTGYPTASGLCNNAVITYTDSWIGQYNEVCKTGTIRRIFTARVGDKVTTCPQLITVATITAPFTVTFPQNNGVSEWGKCNFTIEDARDASNPSIKKPITNYGQCDIVGENITIDTFLFEDGACKKWKVNYKYINWCTGQEIGGFVYYYTYKDEIAPKLVCANQMFAANPSVANPNGGCEAVVVLEASATDDLVCAEESWIKWQMFLDGWNNNSIDRLGSSFVNKSWQNIWVAINKLLPNNSINPVWAQLQAQHSTVVLADLVYVTYIRPSKASGGTVKLPGFILDAENISHKVLWKVTDGCGNVDQCESTLMVVDKKAPTPYCVSVSTALMQSNPKMVELWAKDFDKGAFDNCTPKSKLYFTFEGEQPVYAKINQEHFFKGAGQNATVAEYNQGRAQKWIPALRSSGKIWTAAGTFDIKVSVWDEAWNTDYCSVALTVVDNGPDSGRPLVSGVVATPSGQGVKDANVTFIANSTEFPMVELTATTGLYAMDVPKDLVIDITATKGGDYLNGISTLDLVMIQRHILGVQAITDTHKLIAADVNNDGRITAGDLSELRKLILGVTESFPNASWRFPVAGQIFGSSSPFPYIEQISLIADTSRANNNFVAVKIGDIDGNVELDVTSPVAQTRSNNAIVLTVAEREVAAGETVNVSVTAANFTAVNGYQMTMNVKGASLVSIESGAIEVSNANIGVLANEIVTMSYSNNAAVTADANEVLFTMVLKANKAGRLSEMLSVGSSITKAEAYFGSDMNVGKVHLEVRVDPTSSIALFQNEPNPFKGQTTVSYNMPSAAKVSLKVYDAVGKQLLARTINAVKGMNNETFTSTELGTSGVLFYTLESGDFTATKKMIIIE